LILKGLPAATVMQNYLLSKRSPTPIVMYKHLAFKGPPTVIVMSECLAFKVAPNSNFNVQVPSFQKDSTTISNERMNKSFNPTSIPKSCGLKLLPKMSEKTLSNKSKYYTR